MQKPGLNTSAGFIVGFIGVGLVFLAVLVIVLACVYYRSYWRRKSHGLSENNNVLGPKGKRLIGPLLFFFPLFVFHLIFHVISVGDNI